MKYFKRLFTLSLIFLICFMSFTLPSFAASDIHFGQGYNNRVDDRGKAGAVISCVFAATGVSASPELFSDDINVVNSCSLAVINSMTDYNEQLFDKIISDENTKLTFANGRAKLELFGDWYDSLNPTGIPLDIRGLYEYLFGSTALSGDPFQTTLQTPGYIKIDNKDIIPFRSNKNIASMSGKMSPSAITSRGEYLLVENEDYEALWSTVRPQGGNNHSVYNYPSYSVQCGTSSNLYNYTLRNTYRFEAWQGTDGKALNLWYSGTAFPFWWDRTVGQGVGAFMPVISSEGYITLWSYQYCYSGSYIPGNFGNSNFVLIPFATSSQKPYMYDNGDLVMSSEGIEDVDFSNTAYIIENVNNYEDIINNYYNGTLEVKPDYTDPSTWDTGTTGTATPDGDGGFNIDLGNFHLPDLNIDWKLSGLSEKFPFSIPFDLVRFYSVLNAEPETPHIEGTVDLVIYEWNIDWDLHQFDDIAALVRNLEFIGFCLALMIATKSLIR